MKNTDQGLRSLANGDVYSEFVAATVIIVIHLGFDFDVTESVGSIERFDAGRIILKEGGAVTPFRNEPAGALDLKAPAQDL